MSISARMIVCGLIAAIVPHSSRVDIAAAQLRAHLDAFAHDSMQGRLTGTVGHDRAVRYLVGELRAAGLMAAGDSGAFTQVVPLRRYQLDSSATRYRNSNWLADAIKNDASQFSLRTNSGQRVPELAFLPLTGAFGLATPRRVDEGVEKDFNDMVYAGRLGDRNARRPMTTDNKIVVFHPAARNDGPPDWQLWKYRDQLASYPTAKAIFIASLELLPRSFIARMTGTQYELEERAGARLRTPPIVFVARHDVDMVFGHEVSGPAELTAFHMSAKFAYTSRELPLAVPVRNIVAVIEGSDSALRSEYIVLSAHSDHLGIAEASQRVGDDSVYKGAEDGSGAVALLAIAREMAAAPIKPKRSIVFLWTAASEQGFLGAEYFVDHPTIDRARIVASISLDNIARPDSANGSLEVAVHVADGAALDFSALFASPLGSASALHASVVADNPAFCGGDDWHFARRGIPAVRLTTARSGDSRTVRDETTRINFDAYARITNGIASAINAVANGASVPRRTGALPDRDRPCVW